MSGGVLQRILSRRRRRLQDEKLARPLPEVQARAADAAPALDFIACLRRAGAAGITVLAELKQASPSAGTIRTPFDALALGRQLAEGGAAALSVLTERDHFAGSSDRLVELRAALPATPLLRKDFLVDPWQVWESRALGADAVLLIVAALDDMTLSQMLAASRSAGMAALVEAHDEAELARAVAAGAACIGVNARNLKTFLVDLDGVERLARRLPATATGVAESGVSGAGDLIRLRAAGFHAALVGTALMRQPRPGAALAAWLETAASAP